MKSSNGAGSTVMELQSASFNPDVPSSSASPKVGHSNFRRVSRTEDSSPYPIPGLAADVLHMRVKEGSKIHNLLRFATARIQEEGNNNNGTPLRQVLFTGSGRGVTKTITCVEILKRKVGGLHQVTKIYYKTVNEVWQNPQQGALGITMKRTVPAISVLASRNYSHGKQETDEEFDARWVTYFNKPDIDAWELRKGMNTLIGYDLVPEPKILEAALRACRRLNDLASAIRILEAVKSSLSEESGSAGCPQFSPAGAKLEAMMEQLHRQQGAKLEMNLQEKHLLQAQLLFAQHATAAAAARASASRLDPASFGKADGQAYQVSQQALNSHFSRQGPDEEDEESDEEEEEEKQGLLEPRGNNEVEEDDGEEEEEEEEENGPHQQAKKPRLQQVAGFPFPPFSTPQSSAVKQTSPPSEVKQEQEEKDLLSPAGQQAFTSPNGFADWGYDEPFKQASTQNCSNEECLLCSSKSTVMGPQDSAGQRCTGGQMLPQTSCLLPVCPAANWLTQDRGSTMWPEETDGGKVKGEPSRDFAKLYELDNDPQRKEFLDDLFVFMQKRGTPVNRIPIMAKQVLDLYRLYKLVTDKGGLVEVINKKIWREITKGLNLPTSITSAAFTLRTQYMKYLYAFECEKKGLSSPGELQAAIDSNRREGRRPSYTNSLYRYSPSPNSAPHALLSSPTMQTTPTRHNGLTSASPNLKRNSDEMSTPVIPSQLPMALALGQQQQQQQLAQAATLEHLRERLERGAVGGGTADGPERKMMQLAEEQQRLMQQALQQNLLAIASRFNPMNLKLNNGHENKQDLSLSISTNGAASISVSVEVNGTTYSGK
ncbi:hypothetical protein L3Q82_023821 [Scortum barcoo]|uniref:Uncharacterized protein n=1 Tax=Scortum barcoo TaxID=214431 RepID=A0ACB8WU81_9TELE|nr:hypothetical protein L3Q82_023821 [Scortum barcoo]